MWYVAVSGAVRLHRVAVAGLLAGLQAVDHPPKGRRASASRTHLDKARLSQERLHWRRRVRPATACRRTCVPGCATWASTFHQGGTVVRRRWMHRGCGRLNVSPCQRSRRGSRRMGTARALRHCAPVFTRGAGPLGVGAQARVLRRLRPTADSGRVEVWPCLHRRRAAHAARDAPGASATDPPRPPLPATTGSWTSLLCSLQASPTRTMVPRGRLPQALAASGTSRAW